MTDDEALNRVWREFVPLMGTLKESSEAFPHEWNGAVEEAVVAKRAGDYARSAQIYTGLMVDSGTLYTGTLAGLYKTLAVADRLSWAHLTLTAATSIYDKNPSETAVTLGIPSTFEAHRARLFAAVESAEALTDYLKEISGNPNYRLARDYNVIAEEWRNWTEALVTGFGTPRRSGCYIATAVYGSYDAPPVIVLRRIRDERLATTRAGRLFIRFYYAVSPPIARHFGEWALLNNATRRVLNATVRRLDR